MPKRIANATTPVGGYSWLDDLTFFQLINKRRDETGPRIGHECVVCGRVFGNDAVEDERVKISDEAGGWLCDKHP